MKLETILDKLCCPFDKAEVALQILEKDDKGNVIKGLLNCVECERVYPIVSGIPIMTPDEYRESELEAPLIAQWAKELKLLEKAPLKPADADSFTE
ncbi:MAG TPA: Trm112 family protein [Sphingobacterium sp.]|nr:Trm112 family protein [Sphingobacterium sp.]